jgi:hypothetical protein
MNRFGMLTGSALVLALCASGPAIAQDRYDREHDRFHERLTKDHQRYLKRLEREHDRFHDENGAEHREFRGSRNGFDGFGRRNGDDFRDFGNQNGGSYQDILGAVLNNGTASQGSASGLGNYAAFMPMIEQLFGFSLAGN